MIRAYFLSFRLLAGVLNNSMQLFTLGLLALWSCAGVSFQWDIVRGVIAQEQKQTNVPQV